MYRYLFIAALAILTATPITISLIQPRIAILIPYLLRPPNSKNPNPELPKYYRSFVNSWFANGDIADYHLFVPEHAEPRYYAPNVFWHTFPGNELNTFMARRVRSLLEPFEVKIKAPWQLGSSSRPMYGEIFKEYISNYSHWAWADMDLLWGKISNFITSKELMEHDVITFYDMKRIYLLLAGPFTIFKNNPDINSVWKKIDKNCLKDSFWLYSGNCAASDERAMTNATFLNRNLSVVYKSAAHFDDIGRFPGEICSWNLGKLNCYIPKTKENKIRYGWRRNNIYDGQIMNITLQISKGIRSGTDHDQWQFRPNKQNGCNKYIKHPGTLEWRGYRLGSKICREWSYEIIFYHFFQGKRHLVHPEKYSLEKNPNAIVKKIMVTPPKGRNLTIQLRESL